VKVTTGGISVGVGTLIVGVLSVAAVMTVRDENDGQAECEPQAFEAARAASESFENEYIHSYNEVSGAERVVVVPSDQARDVLDKGTPAPEWSENGYVVIVNYDPEADTPSPPSCYDDTPILYVDPTRVTG
jgi:hypothetical protein